MLALHRMAAASSGQGEPQVPGASGSHRYWRIFVTANNGGSLTAIAELEFRGVIDGDDLTDTVGGTPSANSEANSSNAASKAFDEDLGSKWTAGSAPNPAHWIKWDFVSDQSLEQISMVGNYTPGNQAELAPKDFQIQYSDNDSDWISARNVTGQTGWAGGEARTFLVY